MLAHATIPRHRDALTSVIHASTHANPVRSAPQRLRERHAHAINPSAWLTDGERPGRVTQQSPSQHTQHTLMRTHTQSAQRTVFAQETTQCYPTAHILAAEDTPTVDDVPTKGKERDSHKLKADLHFWKRVPATLPCSLFHLSSAQKGALADIDALKKYARHVPCWIPMAAVADALYHHHTIQTATETQRRAQGLAPFFLWAPEFSNVVKHFDRNAEAAIVVQGVTYYGGAETYFQLMKSAGTPSHAAAQAQVLSFGSALSSMHAYTIGRTHDMQAAWATGEDWRAQESTRVMRVAIRAKFTQHEKLAHILRCTMKHALVQVKEDAIWGSGTDGTGQNRLGVLLEQLREDIMHTSVRRHDVHSGVKELDMAYPQWNHGALQPIPSCTRLGVVVELCKLNEQVQFGLFATRDIEVHERVVWYGGRFMHLNDVSVDNSSHVRRVAGGEVMMNGNVFSDMLVRPVPKDADSLLILRDADESTFFPTAPPHSEQDVADFHASPLGFMVNTGAGNVRTATQTCGKLAIPYLKCTKPIKAGQQILCCRYGNESVRADIEYERVALVP
jgi:ribA/ribD-fused uncharacterized protein